MPLLLSLAVLFPLSLEYLEILSPVFAPWLLLILYRVFLFLYLMFLLAFLCLDLLLPLIPPLFLLGGYVPPMS